MNDQYGSNEFWDNLSRQDMLELGHADQHLGEDYYTALLQRGDEMRRLQRQIKKQGVDAGNPELSTPELGGMPSAGTFTRAHVLLPPGAVVKSAKKKDNTQRLCKAMGLKATPRGGKEADTSK